MIPKSCSAQIESVQWGTSNCLSVDNFCLAAMVSNMSVAHHTSPSDVHRSYAKLGDHAVLRSLDFWRRAGGIYMGYKLAQSQAQILRWTGMTEQQVQEEHWEPHNDRSGRLMYDLCIDLRGFFLKVGQFIGARSDFVPEGVCAHLRKLQDEVPPMPPDEAEAILKQELRVSKLSTVFEWIDLENPLGSASIAQVHKAKLKRYHPQPSCLKTAVGAPIRWWRNISRRLLGRSGRRKDMPVHVVRSGETAWSISNLHGVSLEEVYAVNKSTDVRNLSDGDVLCLPASCRLSGGAILRNRHICTHAGIMSC
eukprot:jgi/Ulvmu1/12704/UM095_0008.1